MNEIRRTASIRESLERRRGDSVRMPFLVVRFGDLDHVLNKAIRRMVFLSLAVHLVLLIRNSSKSTATWLDAITIVQDIEDLPTVQRESNQSFVASLSPSYSSLRGENLSQMLLAPEGKEAVAWRGMCGGGGVACAVAGLETLAEA